MKIHEEKPVGFDVLTAVVMKISVFHSFIHSFIHSSMALQPFVGPWPALQFRNLFYTDGRTPWTSAQPVARPLPTHKTTQTHNKRTHSHPCLGIRTHDPSVRASEDSSCLRPCGHCDRQIYAFWDIVPRSLWKVNKCSGRTCRLHLQGRKISQARHQSESRWQAYMISY
jgi:hypothetical protein